MKTMIIAAALVAALAVPAVRAAVTLTHVHGLAYTADGKRLLIPSHHGLAVYENGEWSKAPGPQHDYMGFAATAKRLYSSGHPAPGSGLANPFGLIRSDDGGRTWRKLALEGETDFHVLATSWNTNAVYVWNPAPSSRIKRPGLHYTLNDGFVWKPARAAGQGTSVFFDLDAQRLWFGTFEDEALLATIPLTLGEPRRMEIPPMKEDALAYIAQNPASRSEYAIATFRRDVYLSKDGGRTWTAIAQEGKTR